MNTQNQIRANDGGAKAWAWVSVWLALLAGLAGVARGETLSLAGPWRFGLDRADSGEAERWFARDLPDTVQLPGSLQLQGFGDPPSVTTRWMGDIVERSFFTSPRYAPYRDPAHFKVPFWLTPTRYYAGAAWYQRDVEIPESWRGRRILLRLERPHWETHVWLDEQTVGTANSLAVPHEYELGDLATPGRHRLTLRVDNRYVLPVGVNSHSVSDHTQGNWNGVAGALELIATPRVWIDFVRVIPDLKDRTVAVEVGLENDTRVAREVDITVTLRSPDRSVVASETRRGHVDGARVAGVHRIELPLGDRLLPWDEFHPNLYDLEVEVRHASGETQSWRERVGFRDVQAVGTQITVNGRPVFLRGTLECAIFPRTGYPPTDAASWKRILSVAKDHGLNHLRFHSWTPPRAAFEAADELGFYLYVECPTWANQGATVGDGTALDAWVYAEGDRILKAHGNHPSFLLMSYGNEPAGKQHPRWLGDLVRHWQRTDPRRLYTSAAGWPMIPENDVHVTPAARAHPVRAAQGETEGDYRAWHAAQNRPILSHEIGQYCVFPNLEEIRKYDGWLKAGNFEIVRDFLHASGMSDQARTFLRASGRLQVAFYKDEIEACLRTPGWGGFELLDLHDFPGQGTALVGVLDPFWESKGYVAPEEFRRFCSPTVPLARVPGRVWTSDQVLRAAIEVAHFGEHDLTRPAVVWSLREARGGGTGRRSVAGHERAGGRFEPGRIGTGRLSSIGVVDVSLEGMVEPTALQLLVTVEDGGTQVAANDWNLWVYPSTAKAEAGDRVPEGVRVFEVFDEEAVRALEAGERVVVLAAPGRVAGNAVGRFDPIFWNRMWFPSQPQHTLGLVLDPGHPALAGFPTANHSDWQWQDLQNHSKPMLLDGFPAASRPLVQVIDDWNTCRKLGLVAEARVGRGRLLLCSIDLASDLPHRPTARALRRSLLAYAAGRRFKPRDIVAVDTVKALFREPTTSARLGARVVSADSEQPGYEAALVLDGDPSTFWHTAWGRAATAWPHEIVIELARPEPLRGLRLLPRQDGNANGWIRGMALLTSPDGKTWGPPVCEPSLTGGGRETEVQFPSPVTARFLKFVARSGFDTQPFASLAELEFLPVNLPGTRRQ